MRAISITPILCKETEEIVMDSSLTICVPHSVESLLNSHDSQHISVSRWTCYKVLMLPVPNTTLTQCNITFLKIHFIDYAITVVPFPPFIPLCLAHPLPPTFAPFSSCPWDLCVSSLASTFPILFLTSSSLFCTYHLCFLFPVPFPPILTPPTPCW